MSDGSQPWPAPGCDRCGRGVEGTRTVVEEHRETLVRVRVLCPECYRAFLAGPAVGHGIRVFKAGDHRRVALDRSPDEGPVPAIPSVGAPVPADAGGTSPGGSRAAPSGAGPGSGDGAEAGRDAADPDRGSDP